MRDTGRFVDPWFRENAHTRRTPPPEPAPPAHPHWHSPWHPPEPTAEPIQLAWLLGDEPRDSAYAMRVRAAFESGRILLGRCVSDGFRDSLGRRILARNVRLAAVPFPIDHASPPVGSGRVIPRLDQGDVLACCVLDDTVRGHQTARIVAQGTSGFSIGAELRAPTGGWNERDPVEVKEVSLVASPQDTSCQALNLNHRDAPRFLTQVLGISEKELSA